MECHFTLHTPHFTLHTLHCTLHTPHSFNIRELLLECHKVPRLPRGMHFHTSQHITFSHFPHRQLDDTIRESRGNFRLSATKSHACHAKCIFARHNTSPFLTFPMDSRTTQLVAGQLSLEHRKVPRLPREMHFRTSQNITFSHFPHRQADHAIRAPRSNFRLSATKSHAP